MLELDSSAIADAWSTVDYSRQVRSYHGRRSPRGDKMRQDDIVMALERIKQSMDPIRRYRSSAAYLPDNDRTDVRLEAARLASVALQRERQKLWKMKTPPKPNRRRKPKP